MFALHDMHVCSLKTPIYPLFFFTNMSCYVYTQLQYQSLIQTINKIQDTKQLFSRFGKLSLDSRELYLGILLCTMKNIRAITILLAYCLSTFLAQAFS